MSLFGSSPDEPSAKAPDGRLDQRNSLFDDDAPPAKKSSGLFNDDAGQGESPGGMPPPKRTSQGDMLKTLLPATQVPESYVDAYDTLGASEHGTSGRITSDGVKKLLDGSRVAQSQHHHILKLVGAGQDGASIGRNEVNVLLALIGLAQEGEELSLDAVDERRKSREDIGDLRHES